jgi:16S rRNA (guanine527-N7)-methyltransferase
LPLPVAAGSVAAITPFPLARNWPGLARAAGQIGVALNAEALASFGRYRDLLLERNTQYNLTAIRDPEGIERKLFLDALAMEPTLDRIVRTLPRNAEGRIRLVDVGTGAGFPGLPLKIVHPELDLTLVDATAKKVTFLNDVIAALGLENARAVHGRAEDLGRDRAFRERFDIATARAVASLPVLLEYVLPLLKVGGTALLPKGLEIEEELRLGRRAAAQLGAEIVSASHLSVEGTRLIVVVKVSRTPTAYPRRTGIPGRSPLGEGT